MPLYDDDGIPYKSKTANGALDYKVDFAPLTNSRTGAKSDWLASGETVTSKAVTAPAGITVDSSSITDTGLSVTAWVSGGTAGSEYDIVVQVSTSGSRTAERTFRIKVVANK